MRPIDFQRLARRFYCSAGWRDASEGMLLPRVAVAFRKAYRACPEAWRSLAWATFGACGPREAPRARWSRWLDAAAKFRRDAAAQEPGSWARRNALRLARSLWFDRDPRDRDASAFRLP